MTNTDKRAEFIQGLREVADFLAEHPEVPLPHLTSLVAGKFRPVLRIYLVPSDQPRDAMATIARAMGRAEKYVNESTAGFELYREFAGITLLARADRNEVCERVVTGVREVTREVPDPAAVVPMVTITETVEDVEWVCQPLLKTASTGLLRVPDEVA